MAAPADLELLHRSFARCLRAENRSAGTIYVYGLAIRQLADYLAGLPDPPGRTADMQRQPIEDFIGSLADEGIAGATLNNRYRSLNRFFGYLLEASGFRTWRSCVRDVRHIWRTSRLPCLHRYRFAVVGMIRRRRGSRTGISGRMCPEIPVRGRGQSTPRRPFKRATPIWLGGVIRRRARPHRRCAVTGGGGPGRARRPCPGAVRGRAPGRARSGGWPGRSDDRYRLGRRDRVGQPVRPRHRHRARGDDRELGDWQPHGGALHHLRSAPLLLAEGSGVPRPRGSRAGRRLRRWARPLGPISRDPRFPAQTYALRFTQPGTYGYACLIHPGMQGDIVVTS